MWRFFVPFNYLKIKHRETFRFNVVFPGVITLVLASPLLLQSFRAGALHDPETMGFASNMIGVLVGFYIAALAAIATFGNPDMDKSMEGPVTLTSHRASEQFDEELTRRRFLSFLFGFLSALALIFLLFAGLYHIADKFWLASAFPTARIALFCIYWLAQSVMMGLLLTHTMLGLFYLTDRINRVSNKPYSAKNERHKKDGSVLITSD